MKKSLLIIAIFVMSTSIITVSGSEDNSKNLIIDDNYNLNKYVSKFTSSFNSPDTQEILGISKYRSSSKFIALDQGLAALNYMLFAEQINDFNEKGNALEKSMSILKFSTSYLINPYLRDATGVIEFYDTILEDVSLAKVSKLARDQAVLLLAFDKVLTFMENKDFSVDNKTHSTYNQSFIQLWSFLEEYLYDNEFGGWYKSITSTIDQSHYSVDKSKRIYDNMLIILALLDVKHHNFFGKSDLDMRNIIFDAMDLFRSSFKIDNLNAISSFGNQDGSFISTDSIYAKENALYGYVNTLLYEKTNDIIYLNEAKSVWQFLTDEFWEIGFGGLFAGLSIDLDPIVTGKPLEDQVFFSLLTMKLSSIEPTNNNYLSKFLTMNELIQLNYIIDSNVASSTDLRFNPSSEFFSRSSLIYYYYLLQIPHIISVKSPNSIIIGSQSSIETKLYLLDNINVNMSISSSSFDKNINNKMDNNSVSNDLIFHPEVTAGTKSIEVNLFFGNTIIQSIEFEITLLPNVKIPNGLIYLGGALILAIMIIVVRRPPEWLKTAIDDFNKIQTPDQNTQDQLEEDL